MNDDSAHEDGLRIDSWLWRTRFYKTRGRAAEAVKGGAVHVNGVRVKSSRLIKPTDTLQLTHPGGRFVLTVIELPRRRGPASEAQACYRVDEHEEATRRRSSRDRTGLESVGPDKRPDKKSRRQLLRLKRR
ncbi:MAG: RNA-binding S4 domain-containing protein [Gammaproteobacteria bacterium]|nr:RNA-binding S4 domain-containing protein [Gammaproteobacteria bacterium]NND37242.1 RNA-binding S4 domain-containing protein [Gammaproteobacteria bacterium]